ncbi:MAG TPA: molybdopterin-dependent oxidoreductase, partial [Burkholderiaceae bacterium]|nr:molybdopterin-dependent oxidoreductase [Burkholderiaceae bacterium]
MRLRRAFGSPNFCVSMELCGWGRYMASCYVYGAPVPGVFMPDLGQAGCILFWGYNPSSSRIAHAAATAAAVQRGARLIVVDPRDAGMAKKSDVWLRVRPGTDGALALGLANVMIERGWYDAAFVRDWTNAPLLVRADNGRLLRQGDVAPQGDPKQFVAWSEAARAPVVALPGKTADGSAPSLFGTFDVPTPDGVVKCHTVFQRYAESCNAYSAARVEQICGIPRDDVVRAAELLWHARPVAFYAWSGIEQHTNATQTARAIGALYALTGSLDSPGGNVLFPAVPSLDVSGLDLLPKPQRAKSLGLAERPLGPGIGEFTTSGELYDAILDGNPYPVRGLVGFGANLLLAQPDTRRGRDALEALDFYVHADLFMSPTAQLADIVLPVTSPFESEGLKIGFEVDADAQSLVQLRKPVVPPRGEARSDVEIIFALAKALGLGEHFWGGDIEAAQNARLAPTGLTLDALRSKPEGIRAPLQSRYRKFEANGFATPTRRIELYSETFLNHGYPPLPEYVAPLVRPEREELSQKFPLVLTCTKTTLFCETQHRALPSLRRRSLHPKVFLHPDAARARGVAAGEWVAIDTPKGSVRAQVELDRTLAPDVVCGQHGWWQACTEIGAPGYDPFSDEGANFNLLVGFDAVDPVSGSVPLRSYVCEIRRLSA